MPYFLASYLSMPKLCFLYNDFLVAFKAYGESLCQKLSAYPSEICRLGHINPHSTNEACRELQEAYKTKCHFTEVMLTPQIDFIYPGVH